MRKWIAIVLLLAASGGALFWHLGRDPAPTPGDALFVQALPRWVIARAQDSIELDMAAAQLLERAAPWPKVREQLESIQAGWPDPEKVGAATAGLNRAAYEARLAYWVDVQQVRKQPVLMTYRVLGRSRWVGGEQAVEVLRVKRLDNLNIEMGLAGHAGGDLPVVLVDRIEESLMSEVEAAFAPEPPGNRVDQLARDRWRAHAERVAGAAALAKAAGQLERRETMLRALTHRLNDGRLSLEPPAGFVWGDAFFDRLAPYAEARRPGGPLLLASDLRGLRRADAALRAGEGRAALDAVLEQELVRIEAHEARHAVDRRPLEVPARLLEIVGDDDLDFARSSERELRAFFGELFDGPKPGCLSLVSIGRGVAGRRARRTPHHFAGAALIERLDRSLDGVPEIHGALERLCALSEEELEQRAVEAHADFYGAPFVRASRSGVSVLPDEAR